MPTSSPSHADPANVRYDRQAFHHSHTSMGGAGHWVKTVGILSPLLIGEMIKDPEKRWRWIRISAVATALLSEAMWTNRIRRERDACRDQAQDQWER